ncbi:segregation/condensation protein A [Faecalibacterium sp. An77]|uniref:segregation and condensation protein A n=1 Tax=Faecalibacterium sp. An77 TaxID=1965655 RepID=UPI000B3679E5|nr:ScpA family protein [Faecalibacterium sp. An77]OUN34069.1 segregation/condensation protein A [Faecalibacterium sp. An77]
MAELTFHLEDFDGPLELLLTLVQAHKMDLHNIPILALIDQYTAVVTEARIQEPDVSSSFIEMAARLVEMKSWLLLPRSKEAEQLKQELTGRLIEYDRCRRLAAQLGARAAEVTVYVRPPARLEADPLYPLHHSAQILADSWQAMAGRVKPPPVSQETFEPLVAAPFVSVESRVVHILRRLAAGKARRLDQLFPPDQEVSATVATFLAVLELVRAGRLEIAEDGGLTIRRGRLARPAPPPAEKEEG